MADQRVIALEGLPFTGKTTAAAALRCSGGVGVVDDYHELLSPAARERMATLSDSTDDQRRRVEMYRELDDVRWKQASAMDARTVVFDRCFISIAAYRVALHRTFGRSLWNSEDPGEFDDIDCGTMIPPEVIYLAVNPDVALDRHARLATSIDVRMRARTFLTNLIGAYTDVLATCDSRIVTVDCTLPLDTVVRAVQRYIDAA